jgi:hypothetical protein
LCDCGNEKIVTEDLLKRGHVKSCGCLKRVAMRKAADACKKDLTGQTIGNLYVMQKLDTVRDKERSITMYMVQCVCGNVFEARGSNIKHYKKCSKCSPNALEDFTGKNFGELTVVKRIDDIVFPSGSRQTCWLCRCSCGKEIAVRADELKQGRVSSCGCQKMSTGEKQIHDILKSFNISFEREFEFDDLLSSKCRPLRFDFAVFKDDMLIFLLEYQGVQHTDLFSKYQYGYIQREYTDKMKKDYCNDHGYKLYEIFYNENVEEKLMTILHDNSVLNQN